MHKDLKKLIRGLQIYGRRLLSERGNRRYKDPEERMGLGSLRNREEASVAGRERERENEEEK